MIKVRSKEFPDRFKIITEHDWEKILEPTKKWEIYNVEKVCQPILTDVSNVVEESEPLSLEPESINTFATLVVSPIVDTPSKRKPGRPKKENKE